jgi:hypothetical protein
MEDEKVNDQNKKDSLKKVHDVFNRLEAKVHESSIDASVIK